MPVLIAALLVLAGAASRLVPHSWNFVPIGAIALYAGARLPRRWAFLVPLLAMFASDVVLDWGRGSRFLDPVRLTSYATLAAVAALGGFARGRVGVAGRAGMSAGASTLFFLTTNFAVWAAPIAVGSATALDYPPTAAGLLACYAAGVPFYQNALAADLLGTAVLFGLDALARRAAERSRLGALASVRVTDESD